MVRRVFTVFALLLGLAASAHAQTPASSGRVSLTTGLAFTSQWDDETHLGGGPLFALGVSATPVDAIRLEAEVSLARHHRNSGYLEATGTPVVLTGRAAWRMGSARWAARPFVSVGGHLTHSRGEFISSSIIPGPDGRPIDGPKDTRTWRVTEPGMEFGLGVEVRGRGRMWWRPEVRVSGTRGQSGYEPGVDTLETPILAIRAGMTVIW